MPVVDGPQFLKLLQRNFPGLLKVVLTGDSTGAYRAACLNSGAELFLEKPRVEGGWQSIHAALHELLKLQPHEAGFRGVLRRVGLQDVLQMECLARNSSVLEITAGQARGQVFIRDGQIIHADVGGQTGESAFYQLLALAGGEFNLNPFVAPPAQTIDGSWEFLLMEAARKRDESAEVNPAASEEATLPAGAPPGIPELVTAEPDPALTASEGPLATPTLPRRPLIEEVLVCSLQGDVLYEWQSAKAGARISFLEFLSLKAHQLAQGLPLGSFDRLEIEGPGTRVVTQIQIDRAIFIRASRQAMVSPA